MCIPIHFCFIVFSYYIKFPISLFDAEFISHVAIIFLSRFRYGEGSSSCLVNQDISGFPSRRNVFRVFDAMFATDTSSLEVTRIYLNTWFIG